MFFSKTKSASLSMKEAKAELGEDPDIRLIDVRTRDEYRAGHIPGSVNLPLDQADGIATVVPNKSEKIFVYCLSGARSRSAAAYFTKLGYEDVSNIGGIAGWPGEIERG